MDSFSWAEDFTVTQEPEETFESLGTLEPFNAWTDNMSDFESVTQLRGMFRRGRDICRVMPLYRARYVSNVLVCLPVAVFGIIANSLSFVVLAKQKPRLTTTVLLQALAVADTGILLVMALLYSFRYLHVCTGLLETYMKGYNHIFRWLYPAVYSFKVSSTWLTVLLSIDRYIAVCHPLHAQRLCTIKAAKRNIAILVLLTLICSLPRFFEYGTESGRFVETELLANKYYTVVYRIIAFFILAYLLPMILLISLNSRLLCALYKSNAYRTSLQQANTQTRANNRSITIVVLTIVVMCIMSDFSGSIAHILYSIKTCFSFSDVDIYRRYLSNVHNVTTSVNSAGNFVIYCLCSRNFRLALKSTFSCPKEGRSCLKKPANKKQKNSSTRTYYFSLSRSSSNTAAINEQAEAGRLPKETIFSYNKNKHDRQLTQQHTGWPLLKTIASK